MTIDINKNSALIDSAASGYSGCGCGNRRYYTKAEIDEMLKDILDPEKVKEILDEMFEDYIESGDLYDLIISIIGDIYTKDEINALLSGKLDTTAFTQAMASETARTENTYVKKSDIPSGDYATEEWVEGQGYLKDITLTINGTDVHNNGSIIIEGGGGEPIDLSDYAKTTAVTEAINTAIATETGRTEDVYAKKTDLAGKLDTSVFTAYTSSTETWENNMNDCCDEVKSYMDYLKYLIDDLQRQIDELQPEPGPTPEPTGDTFTLTTVYDVTSTTEPTLIINRTGNINIKRCINKITYNGVDYDLSSKSKYYFTFPQTGEQTVQIEFVSSTIPDWCFYRTPLKRITIPNGITKIGEAAFEFTLLSSIIIPNSVTEIGESALRFVYDSTETRSCNINIGTGLTTIGITNWPRAKGIMTYTLNATVPPTIKGSGYVFSVQNIAETIIYVPSGSVNAYKATNITNNPNVIQAKP